MVVAQRTINLQACPRTVDVCSVATQVELVVVIDSRDFIQINIGRTKASTWIVMVSIPQTFGMDIVI